MNKIDKKYSIYSVGKGDFDKTFKVLFTTLHKLEAQEVLKNRLLRAKDGEKVYMTEKPFAFKKEKHPILLRRCEEYEKEFNPFMRINDIFSA